MRSGIVFLGEVACVDADELVGYTDDFLGRLNLFGVACLVNSWQHHDEEHHRRDDEGAGGGVAVAAEGDIEVILEPVAERDVPPFPR